MSTTLDALIVGAGFNGCQSLAKLRRLGFTAKIYEAGNYFGGTWWWNRYPGARVDAETPIYQLTVDKDLWEGFQFKERFPGREELQRYFRYADQTLELSKDTLFNTNVDSAEWDDNTNLWTVKTNTGLTTTARHLILCTGFAAKRYTPPFKGLEKFKGIWHHTGVWPEEGVDVKGKRVAIIGTGASGVQVIQEIGPQVGHLTVYQRTPNLAIPMRQVFLEDKNKDVDQNGKWQFPEKPRYEEIFKQLHSTFGSLVIDMDFTAQKFIDASPAERRALYEYLWNYGGFSFWLATYKEIFFSQEANDEVYAFWAEHTRARLNDPKMKDLLAPLKAPHAWGTRRPCLETSFYEIFNQQNVDLIDVNESPILEITEEGVKTNNEGVIPIDVLIIATGFDSVTGGILNIKITNKNTGESIQDKWGKGTKTYLGLSTVGFPNMYWLYGPHAPTAFSNGPICGGIQSDYVCDLMVKMREQNKIRIEAKPKNEDEWTHFVHNLWNNSLMPGSKSWYEGYNIPGKRVEPLNYFGGIPEYIKYLETSKNNNYEGFILD